MQRIGCFVIPVLLFAAAAARAEPPLVTDRPDFTESPVVVPRGAFQVEGGYTFARSGEEQGHSLGEILARIGPGSRIEARIGINSFRWVRDEEGSRAGMEDGSIGLKFALAGNAESPGVRAALILATSTPTGRHGMGEKDWQPGAKLCVGGDLPAGWSLSGNLNAAWPSVSGRHFGQAALSLSLGRELGERVGAYAEYFGIAPDSPDGVTVHYLDGGITLLAHPALQLDVRGGLGLNGVRPDGFVGLGVAGRWRTVRD